MKKKANVLKIKATLDDDNCLPYYWSDLVFDRIKLGICKFHLAELFDFDDNPTKVTFILSSKPLVGYHYYRCHMTMNRDICVKLRGVGNRRSLYLLSGTGDFLVDNFGVGKNFYVAII